MSRRALALATGVAVVATYAVLAAVSGHLSSLARRPIFDGLTPFAYRWVNPPPQLAANNIQPSSGRFSLAVWPGHSQGTVFSTDDAQVTVIVPKDAIPYEQGQRSVDVDVEPLDPAKLSAPQSPLTIAGNVYRITATYRPSGDPLRGALAGEIEIVLVYPALLNAHGGHALILSPSGRSWTEVKTTDLVSVGQVDAQVARLGYLASAVTGEAASSTPTIPGAGATKTSFPVALVIGVIAAVVLIGGAALGIRNSRGRPPARRQRR